MSPCMHMLYSDTIEHVESDNISLQQTTENHQDRSVQTVKPGSESTSSVLFDYIRDYCSLSFYSNNYCDMKYLVHCQSGLLDTNLS